jgi:hypothetical protein
MMDGGFEPATERLATILLPVFQALRGEFEARLATLRAQGEIRTEAADRALFEMRRAIAEVTNKLPVLQTLSGDFARQVATLDAVVKEHRTSGELALAELRAAPPTLPVAEPYYAGKSYRPGDVAIFEGGLWQAQIHTTAPPDLAGADWGLVIDGLRGVSVDQDAHEPRLFQLGFHLTSGVIEQVQLSLLSGPEGPPGLSGSTGERGRGIVGWKSPEPGKIQLIFDDDELSEPLDLGNFRFCGTYSPGSSYRAADIVRLGYNLWIALVPTGTVPSQTSPDWSLFLPGAEPGPSGGSRRGGGGGNFLPLTGGTLTGPLVLPTGVAAAGSLQFSGNGWGMWRDVDDIVVQSFAGTAFVFNRLNGNRSAAPIAMGNFRITGLGAPVDAGDAATKAYVDANSGGGGGGDYLPLAGGVLTGNLLLLSSGGPDADIGITIGGRFARMFWNNGLIFSRGQAGESLFIENQNGTGRSEILTQTLGDARYLNSTGGALTGPLMTIGGNATQLGLMLGDAINGFHRSGTAIVLALELQPVMTWASTEISVGAPINMGGRGIANVLVGAASSAVNRQYVDDAIAGVGAPTTLRTQVYTPTVGNLVIQSPTTLAQRQMFLDDNFALPAVGLRNLLITIDPLFDASAPASLWNLVYTTNLIASEVPMSPYRISADTPTGVFRASAKFLVGVDATPGTIRIICYVHSPSNQAGGGVLTQLGAAMAPIRTLITVQDLGPLGV